MRHESHEPTTRRNTVPDMHFRAVTIENIHDIVFYRAQHAAFGNCSCMRWRMRSAEFARSTKSVRVSAFDALVESGTPVGILAYLKDTPIGWCSIAPRDSFAGLKVNWSRTHVDNTLVWSVTCFYVEPRHRREGISVRLLRAAVEYARSEGAKAIEGYPVEPGKDPHASMGSPSTFRRAGFRDVTPPGRMRRVMRNVVR